MSETIMPAVEANTTTEREPQSYEFAFHVLPTIAEGEVSGVFDTLKAHITKAGGEIFDEESPLRFDLAYEIEKYLEGKNRKFSSAYFGWIRFRLPASNLTDLTEELDSKTELLRYLLIKLTKLEAGNSFRFHDSVAHRKVETITDEELAELATEAEAEVLAEEMVSDEVEVEVLTEDDSEEAK